MKSFIRILASWMLLGMFAYIPVKAQMNGTYTVGSGGTYASLTAAYNALVSNRINGPVTLSVISDLSGQQTLSGSVIGTSTINKITITSATGNLNSYTVGTNSSSYALYIANGVKDVLIKNLTIGQSTNSSQNYGVYFTTSTTPYTNIEFRGCNINTLSPTNSSSYAAVFYQGSGNSSYYFNNLRFIKNNINGGYYNFYFNYLSGAANNMASRVGATIDSNVLTNAYYYGIYSNYHAYYPSISYNTITSLSSSAAYRGIYTNYYTTIDSMIGNKITITSTNQAYGLYLAYCQNQSTTYGANGPMYIVNNEIRILSSASTSYGLYAYGAGNNSRFDVINNSFYVNGTSTCYGLYWYPTTSASYTSKFINNNIHINTSSTAYMVYFAGGIPYDEPAYSTVNYNNYYRSGTGTTTYYGSTSYTTLANWKYSGANQDAKSIEVLPSYINSAVSLELNDYSNVLCPRAPNVLYNIKGEARTNLTSMGAYSTFIFEGYNMGIESVIEPVNTDEVSCFQDYASVKVAIANRGNLPINFVAYPMTLRIDVQGVINFHADTIISVGSLSATRKDTIEITNLLPVSLSGVYNITAWLELGIDAFSADDTIESVYIVDKIKLPYNINFDTTPKGLIFNQLVGSSGWTVESGDGVNPSISPSHGTGRLQFLSEKGLGSMAKVIMQPINLRGTASPKFEVWYAHDNANPTKRDYTEVKISIDGGETFQTLRHLQRYNVAYAAPTFVRYEIPLTSYTTYSCVIFAFEAGSYMGGNQNIDSIAITSKQDISVALEVSKQSEFVACELGNKNFRVKLTNMTAQEFNFENNSSQINVKVSGTVDTLLTVPLMSGTIQGDTTLIYDITNTFDFSRNGTYNLMAYLTSADDNAANDTALVTRIVRVDAELIGVDPISSKEVGDLVFPTVYITNNGNMPINGIPLIITINNVKVIWETIDTLLNSGDSISFTFTQPYSAPNAAEQQPYYQMKIEIDLRCDGVKANNSHTKYYDVDIKDFIDLVITEIFHPIADSCNLGFTKIYPSIEVYNRGTGYAQDAVLQVFVDSLNTIIQSFSEILDNVARQDAITFNCLNYYTVPNFTGIYTVIFNIVCLKDVDTTNNSKSVVACADEALSIASIDENTSMLGQNIPNPATLSTRIPYTLPVDGKVHFKVMTINGQLLYNEEIQASAGTHYLELNTATLSNGIYYYSMEYEGQIIVKKITVQK